MKASSHEKHSKQQWKKQKKTKKKVQTHGQGLGRGLAGDMGLNFLFFLVFPWFFAVWPKPQEHKKNKKKSSDPWARSGLSTHKPKNQKTKKPKNKKKKKQKKQKQKTKEPKNQKNKKNKKTRPNTLHLTPSPWGVQSWFFCFFCFLVSWFFGLCVDSPDLAHGSELFVFFCVLEVLAKLQKTMEKPKNQKNKKPRNQKTKKTKKTKKNKIAHPKGRGSDAECWVLSFCFFWFFGFLVWIAIADVPSRDCQALSVVALEARSIHYSTAMFAMT